MHRPWIAVGAVVLAVVFGSSACTMMTGGDPAPVPAPRSTSGGGGGGGADRSDPASDGSGGGVAERVPGTLVAEARAGFIRFTWPRFTDWRSGLKAASADRDTERWRWRVVLSDTGAFAGEEREFIVPSVSDCRHFNAFPEGGGAWTPDPDPSEECDVFGVPDGATLRGKVGLVHIGTDGTIDKRGPMSNVASARMDTGKEPREFVGATSAAQTSLDDTYVLFEALVGGSLTTGALAVDYSGVDFDNYAVNDSWWRGMRVRMDRLLAGAAAPYAASNGVGFLFRAPNGDNRAWLDSRADPKTSTVFWLLQGGRLPQPQQAWSVVGGGTSPGMLDCWQSFDHAVSLRPGRTRNRVLSLTQDLGQLDGITQPIVMYQSCYGAAHKVVWDEDILRAFGLHVPLRHGFIPALDVLCTGAKFDPELGTNVKTPEYRVAEALQAEPRVRRFFGETMLSGNSRYQAEVGALSKLGDIQAFDLYINDPGPKGYTAARAKADPSVRLDVADYLRPGRANLRATPPAFRMILRVNAGTCAYVQAGRTAEERCSRALIVARDLVHTWGRRAIPCLMNQAFWRGFNAGELAEFMREAGWSPSGRR